jgi:hypothetical protein
MDGVGADSPASGYSPGNNRVPTTATVEPGCSSVMDCAPSTSLNPGIKDRPIGTAREKDFRPMDGRPDGPSRLVHGT